MTNKDIFRELGGLNAHTVLDAAPDKPVGAPVWLRIAAAAACAVLILAGALAAPHLLPDTPSLPTDSSSNPTTQPITQPLTPPVTEPQKPVFNTVVRPVSLANSPQYGSIGASIYPETFTFSYNPDETFNLDDHRACGNVCYSVADGYFFCPGCTLKELLKDNKSINTDKILVKHFSPAQNKALFICRRKSYIYDFKTGELKDMNIDLYNTATLTVRDMSEKDGAYALIPGTPGYWLVNLDTAEIVQVAKAGKDGKNLPTMDDYTFISRGQKYVYYALAEGDYAATKQGTTVFLNLETRERTLVTGLVYDGTPDDHYFKMETEDGLMVFDTEKNAVVPFEGSGMPDVYRYSLRPDDIYNALGYYNIDVYKVVDRVTDEVVYSFTTPFDVTAKSVDRRYIYAYTQGESALRVFDLTALQEGIAPLEESFLNTMSQPEYTNFKASFTLAVRPSDGTVILTYKRTEIERPDMQKIESEVQQERERREKAPLYTLKQLIDCNELNSLAALEKVLEKHPEFAKQLVAFEGDGYLYLQYNALYSDYRGRYVYTSKNELRIAFEDYRTQTFYTLLHDGSDVCTEFKVDRYSLLEDTAQAKTKEMLMRYDIPIYGAEVDYGLYLAKGKTLKDKMIAYVYTPNHIVGSVELFFLDKVVNYAFEFDRFDKEIKAARDSAESISKMEEFVRFAAGLTYVKSTEKTSPDKLTYKYRASIRTTADDYPGMRNNAFNTYIYTLGSYGGKLYVERSGYRAYITQEEYTYWTEWFDAEFYEQYK